jgi:hypothetical protein
MATMIKVVTAKALLLGICVLDRKINLSRIVMRYLK